MSTLPLTPEQSAILQARDPAILVSAVAGSGKSTTLAHAAALRLRRGTPPERILALVFSDTARQVFLNYLAQAGHTRADVTVRTYDEYARSLLDAWVRLGYIDGAHTRRLTSLDTLRPWIYQAIEDAAALGAHRDYYEFTLNDTHAEYILDTLTWLKGTLRLRHLDDMSISEFARQEDLPEGLVSILREYERARSHDVGLYEFQSAQDYVYDCLTTLAGCDYIELPRFDLIVADEWHDINEAHLQLLQRLHTGGGQLIAAGDADQVIHTRHGAHPDYMGPAFLAAFGQARRTAMPLSRSFRCGPTLALAAGSLAHKTFESWRTQDTEVSVLLQTQLYQDQPDGLAHYLQRLRQRRGESGFASCAILLRSPDLSIDIENELIRQEIPYQVSGFDSYFERDEILILRGILALLCEQLHGATTAAEALPILQALGRLSEVDMPEHDWQASARDIAINPQLIRYFYSGQLNRPPAHAGSQAHPTTPGQPRQENDTPHATDAAVPPLWRGRLVSTIEQLRPLRDQASAGELLRQACTLLHLPAYARRHYLQQEQADGIEHSIQAFVEHAEQSKLAAAAFLETVASTQRQSQRLRSHAGSPRQQAPLQLCTIAAAKGKEWPVVIVPGLSRLHFPRPQAQPAEERRLLYVAATRAQTQLVLVSDDAHHPYLQQMDLSQARAQAAAMLEENRARQADTRIYLHVPFEQRADAKNKGAQWDPIRRQWWIRSSMYLPSFRDWLPPDR
ncbi:MAG: ATP-dependent helicase [Corticimicrobacter sp.]|uniref:ATP-dependent helicase n=1 Tax=Corticimicrobacter sp. TaxID=2678536 RepID=UPI0032D9E2DA